MYVLKKKNNGRYLHAFDNEGLTFSFVEKAIIFDELIDATELLTILDNLFYLDEEISIFKLSEEEIKYLNLN